MSETDSIDALLAAPPSLEVAGQLVAWAQATRERIARGEMMIGILTADEVAKISTAYRRAAQCGDSAAWLALAWWLAHPDYGEPDLEAAESALQTAIDANVDNAAIELAKIRYYFKRETATELEQKQAFDDVSERVASAADDSDAIYLLALLTTHGFGVAASPEQGIELQQRAAELGNADAMFELYIHFASGLGTAIDEALALEYCQRAADAGHGRAMYNIGAFNASGRGMPKNIPQAIQWYERAADAGNPSAMLGLGVIYAMGDGVEVDRQYAEQMFDQAEYFGLDVSQIRKQVGL